MPLAACQSTGDTATGSPEPIDAVDQRIWFDAAEDGNAELLQALIDDGIDPTVDNGGFTALHIVARDGHVDAARALIDTGMDIDPEPDEYEALLADAAGHSDPQIVELLAGKKLDPDTVAALASLRTPLNLAVQNGHAEMVELLIEAGADVNAKGEWYTPLHSAVLIGDAEIVSILLNSGASTRAKIRIQDRTRFSGFRYVGPVELATLIERDDLVEMLQRRGGRD